MFLSIFISNLSAPSEAHQKAASDQQACEYRHFRQTSQRLSPLSHCYRILRLADTIDPFCRALRPSNCSGMTSKATPALARRRGPNGSPDTYGIVAGIRRYHAALAVTEGGELDELPCAIMDAGDDAAALEASLIENIARLDPERARYIANRLDAGRVAVNGLVHEPLAPFGGFKESGVEREYGPMG